MGLATSPITVAITLLDTISLRAERRVLRQAYKLHYRTCDAAIARTATLGTRLKLPVLQVQIPR